MERNKGKRGELEVAALLNKHGFNARRGQQRRGGADSPDIIHDITNVHIEVKLRETLSSYPALEQALNDSRLSETPVLFHRRNRKPWIVIMYAEDFLLIMKELIEWRHERDL